MDQERYRRNKRYRLAARFGPPSMNSVEKIQPDFSWQTKTKSVLGLQAHHTKKDLRMAKFDDLPLDGSVI